MEAANALVRDRLNLIARFFDQLTGRTAIEEAKMRPVHHTLIRVAKASAQELVPGFELQDVRQSDDKPAAWRKMLFQREEHSLGPVEVFEDVTANDAVEAAQLVEVEVIQITAPDSVRMVCGYGGFFLRICDSLDVNIPAHVQPDPLHEGSRTATHVEQ